MSDLFSITWNSLKNPIALSVVIALLMQFFGKKLIGLLVDLLPENKREQFRSLAINFATLGLCYLIAALHINEQFLRGDAFVVSLQAMVLATSEYQAVKSISKVFGRNGAT